ncbi:uncharacterized protein LOC117102018 [Anneissia japonica]|uniref:uncharacterized protein LOC117102018 n=1 Tax=Anneissia japonica TaxID=1529436 RepID=UPI0014256DD4|nr:uncharacterized protein LOC117102018 [Anneissia japonica]
MKSHLQSVHWASRIEFDDKTSVLCKCNNFNKITPRHWHCPLCTDVTFAKSIRLLHHILATHKPITSVKRYCQGKLMSNVSQVTKIESPKRREKPPGYSESLVYNGVGCDIIWCDRDAHCDGWHCPFCTTNGKRYLMKRHLRAVHWASRVEAGEMKSVLCKCPLTKLKDQRHYHCPLCTNVSFAKPASLQKHILRVHKPTADVKQYSRNQVINVMEAKPAIDAFTTSEEAMEATGAVEATEASEATETVEATEAIETTEAMEAIAATDAIEATEAMKVMEAIQNDVQPVINKHERQIDWDMIKCTETGHCEGWHCSLCIMTGDIQKLKQHFSANHWGSRVEVGDLAIVTCKCRKVSGLGHHHWHCPLCVNRSFSRIVTLEDHFVYTHKPNAEVKRFSRGNLVTTNDYTNSVGSTQPKLEYGSEQTTADAPPVQDCSVLKCEVEGHCVGWHCPFCAATGERCRMKSHIQAVHWGSRVEIGESWSVLCKCKSTGKTTPRHWHCTLCTNSTFVKAQILETHMIRIHKVEENIKRFSRSKLVAVNGVVVTGNVVEVRSDVNLDTPIDHQEAASVNLDTHVVNLDTPVVHIVTPDDADVAVEEIIAFTDAWEMLQKELQ